jgi:putative sterol carrier protein
MTGRIKVKGDLLLAQKLEEVFEKMGGREVCTHLSVKIKSLI